MFNIEMTYLQYVTLNSIIIFKLDFWRMK